MCEGFVPVARHRLVREKRSRCFWLDNSHLLFTRCWWILRSFPLPQWGNERKTVTDVHIIRRVWVWYCIVCRSNRGRVHDNVGSWRWSTVGGRRCLLPIWDRNVWNDRSFHKLIILTFPLMSRLGNRGYWYKIKKLRLILYQRSMWEVQCTRHGKDTMWFTCSFQQAKDIILIWDTTGPFRDSSTNGGTFDITIFISGESRGRNQNEVSVVCGQTRHV